MMILSRRLIIAISLTLIALLPFQTLVTVWLASNFDHLYIWSAWKELLIGIMTLLAAYLLIKDASLRKAFLSKRYNQLALIYLALGLFYVVAHMFSNTALIGFAIDFRFILVFLSVQLVAMDSAKTSRLLLVVGTMVAVLSLVQIFLLAPDFLTHFGYDPVGVNTPGIPPAYHAVAAESDLVRAQATLRGPNALGAFLILPIFISYFAYLKGKKKIYIAVGLLCLAGILLSYSRSAFLSLLLAFIAYGVYKNYKSLAKIPKKFTFILFVLMLVSLLMTWRTSVFQEVVLHNNPEVNTIQSNEGHLRESQSAVKDMLSKPLGYGLGEAGPSSTLKNQAEGKISENYYLQVGLEMGLLGLGLILAIHYSVFRELLINRRKSLGLPVLLAFGALAISNLLLHNWADEVVAVTVWLFIGSQLSVMNNKSKYKNLP